MLICIRVCLLTRVPNHIYPQPHTHTRTHTQTHTRTHTHTHTHLPPANLLAPTMQPSVIPSIYPSVSLSLSLSLSLHPLVPLSIPLLLSSPFSAGSGHSKTNCAPQKHKSAWFKKCLFFSGGLTLLAVSPGLSRCQCVCLFVCVCIILCSALFLQTDAVRAHTLLFGP